VPLSPPHALSLLLDRLQRQIWLGVARRSHPRGGFLQRLANLVPGALQPECANEDARLG
jgi:hypothetical protein